VELARGKLKGNIRIGFMSRVSPDGQYVATTVNPAAMSASTGAPPSNYYVANFKDYRFLQVFYPTRGILSWFSRATGVLRPLPGADDPRFVQMGGVWSPDGQYLVFARAAATDPNPPGVPLAKFANDPNELQIQYDLYRIPFHNGAGGVAEPIAGASQNGMSNTFPKVSPDGRWIVFVECRNGQLMRPDSSCIRSRGGRRGAADAVQHGADEFVAQLFAQRALAGVLVEGTVALHADVSHAHRRRRQRQSGHSDREHNRGQPGGEPAGICEHCARWVAADRRPGDRLLQAGGWSDLPAKDRVVRSVRREVEAGAGLNPGDEFAERKLGALLLMMGHREESAAHCGRRTRSISARRWRRIPHRRGRTTSSACCWPRQGACRKPWRNSKKAVELKPDYAVARTGLGSALAKLGKLDEAMVELHKAIESDARYAPAHYELGLVLSQRGDVQGAMAEWRSAIEIDPKIRGST